MERIGVMPAWIYQRYQPFFDRLIPAMGMAVLFGLTAQATGTFSREWQLFIAGGIAMTGMIAPIAGYVFFMLALAYPLYSISIYVAALALSILVLLTFFIKDYLAALVLVLFAPLLSTYRVAPVVPILAGLWWAEWGGALAGLGGALWLKIFAGMSGATPDLMRLGGQSLPVHQLIARFQTANSFQTLVWMGEPLSTDPQALLLHVLEVFGWSLAGYGVGLIRGRMAGMQRPSLGLVASVGAGLLGVGVGSWVLPAILGLRGTSGPSISNLLAFLVEYCWSGLIAMGMFGIVRYLRRPVVMPAPDQMEPRHSPARSQPELLKQAWEGPRPYEDEQQSDIIMIDLD